MTTELVGSTQAICTECGESFDAMTLQGKQVVSCCSDPCTERRRLRFAPPKEVSIRKSGWTAICPPKYAAFDISRLPAAGKAVANRVLGWNAGNANQGIALIGPSNAGKSMLMHEVARQAYEQGFDVHLVSSTGFAYAVSSGDMEQRRKAIERAIRCAILFIDDVGKEKMTERVESDFYHVLEERERWNRLLLFTANSRGTDLEANMSEDRGSPIVNRLRRMAECIVVKP